MTHETVITYAIPKKWVKVRAPRILSEEMKKYADEQGFQLSPRMDNLCKSVTDAIESGAMTADDAIRYLILIKEGAGKWVITACAAYAAATLTLESGVTVESTPMDPHMAATGSQSRTRGI